MDKGLEIENRKKKDDEKEKNEMENLIMDGDWNLDDMGNRRNCERIEDKKGNECSIRKRNGGKGKENNEDRSNRNKRKRER